MQEELLRTIYAAADDKKGAKIRVLDISKVAAFADYFVLITGFNKPQVQAICDNIEEEMRKQHDSHTRQVEGYHAANWILMDYGNIVVHIFDDESRHFYDLDRTWSDAKEIILN